MTANNDKTMFFDFGQERQEDIKETLKTVYESLEEKGYNPINQIGVTCCLEIQLTFRGLMTPGI